MNHDAVVFNNPLTMTDPSGQFALPPPSGCPICDGMVAGHSVWRYHVLVYDRPLCLYRAGGR
jgi:hypothetical protein